MTIYVVKDMNFTSRSRLKIQNKASDKKKKSFCIWTEWIE